MERGEGGIRTRDLSLTPTIVLGWSADEVNRIASGTISHSVTSPWSPSGVGRCLVVAGGGLGAVVPIEGATAIQFSRCCGFLRTGPFGLSSVPYNQSMTAGTTR